MTYPEITQRQILVMRQVCSDPDMSVFSQCSPKSTDNLGMAVLVKQANDDSEYLVSLGFLKNITADHQERITKVNAETGREWSVYEVTDIGRAMFQANASEVEN